MSHVERIEQCGERVVVTSSGIIHDMGPNATGGLNSNDTEGGVYFTLGQNQYRPRTSAGMAWQQKMCRTFAYWAGGRGGQALSRWRKLGLGIR